MKRTNRILSGQYRNITNEGRYKILAWRYARMKISGEVDIESLIRVFDRHEQKPKWRFQRLIKNKEFQKMVNDEMKKIFEEEGIDHQGIIRDRKEILKIAKEGIKDEAGKYVIKPDLSNANKALDALEQYFNENKKSSTSWHLEAEGGWSELDEAYQNAKADKQKVLESRERKAL